jgi:hypothetical protein
MVRSFRVGVGKAQITWVLTIEASLVAVGVKISSAIQKVLLSNLTTCSFLLPPVAEVKPMKAMLEFRIAPVRSTVFVSL